MHNLFKIQEKSSNKPNVSAIQLTTERPPSCTPSPCGPHSRCQLLASGPACSCLPGYVGSPPSCRPECTINSECPASLACVRQKCDDPCPGSCGIDANCHVLNHVAVCVCNEGFTGDPFSRCVQILEGKNHLDFMYGLHLLSRSVIQRQIFF